MPHIVILVLFFWVSCACSALPPVTFKNLSSADGLPQNTARTMLQDKNGFVWIGTEDGLVRFDGYSMKSFRKQYNSPKSLSDNYISALAESQDGRIWVGTMGGGLNVIQPRTGKVDRLKELGTYDIRAITLGPNQEVLWLGTNAGLHYLNIADNEDVDRENSFDKSESVPIRIPLHLPDGTSMEEAISGIVVQEGEIWFSTRGKGIGRYIQTDKSVTWYRSGEIGLKDDTFNTMTVDHGGNIWAGGQNHGLVQIIRQSGTIHFKHYDKENSGLGSNDVMTIADAGNEKLWVGTWNGGLALFSPVTGKAKLYRNRADDPHSLSSDIIMDILCTRDGQVWVGTFDRGVSWFDPDLPFRAYRAKSNDDEGLPGNLVWSFASGNEKKLWVGSNKGLTRLDLDSHEYELPKDIHPAVLWEAVHKDDIRAMLADGDYLWIAARHSGLVRLTLSTGKLTPITDLLAQNSKLTHSYIRVILKDKNGYLWLGTSKGLNRFNPSTRDLLTFMENKDEALALPHHRIRALFEDSKGQIWVGTSEGVLLINEQGEPSRVWQFSSSEDSGVQILAGNGVRGFGEDSKGRIWLATEGGISIYDQRSEKVIILREEDGLPSNATYCALPADNYMWVSTLRGLARIDTTSLKIESYYISDGLPNNEFNFNAWHKLNEGRLVFGTLSGFSVFSPRLVSSPDNPVSPLPLQLQVYVNMEDTSLLPVIAEEEPAFVGWRNNHIGFEYSAMHYGSHDTVIYQVFLQGLDQDWQDMGSQHLVSYSGLASGRYTFQVRARDRHSQWQVEALPVPFIVAAPPWKTFQAYILYGILGIGSVFLVSMLYNRRLRNRAETLEVVVADRTAELEESSHRLVAQNEQLDRLMKGRELLFRAVSHELRTPLSVIISVLESVQNEETGALTKIPMARRSAQRLGKLLGTILDLSHREEESRKSVESFQIQSVFEEVISSYETQVQLEEKTLIFDGLMEEAWLGLPREIFVLMLSNLLSNACKYTESGCTVSVKVSVANQQLWVRVEDNGIGIPEGMEERIFDWFERGDSKGDIDGWGIGLAFVRESAEKAGGSIRLQLPEDREGTQFILKLPLSQKSVLAQDFADTISQANYLQPQIVLPGQEQSRTLLLIEDDLDLLQLLPGLFPSHWNCLTTTTAETGWSMALDVLPDLVITDLMLPGESGFDLTKKLKEDDRTAHIPVIILTALSNEENRFAGLGLTADSFMGKPFDNHELLLRVQGLITNRERVFERVKRLVIGVENETGKSEQQLHTPEENFLEKLHTALSTSNNLSSMTLGDVASKLAMSTRSLQREMQRLGISWREYKRLRKLRVAMDLLRNPASRVKNVAEEAGYSSAAYFSKIFKKQTGFSPTDWKRLQQNK